MLINFIGIVDILLNFKISLIVLIQISVKKYCLIADIFSLTLSLSKMLQKSSLDVVAAWTCFHDTMSILKVRREKVKNISKKFMKTQNDNEVIRRHRIYSKIK